MRSTGSDGHASFRAVGVILSSCLCLEKGDSVLFKKFFEGLTNEGSTLAKITHCPYLKNRTADQRKDLVTSVAALLQKGEQRKAEIAKNENIVGELLGLCVRGLMARDTNRVEASDYLQSVELAAICDYVFGFLGL